MVDPFEDEAKRQKYIADELERERNNTVHCPYCGTAGVWTFAGVLGPWSKDDGKRLTEFSETLRWTGTHEYGPDHTPERCLAKCGAEAARILDGLVESRVLDRQMTSDLAAVRRVVAGMLRESPPEWARATEERS
jgi:hypothetical protein